jgi:hypothetical protein
MATFPARLHVLLASDAPLGLVIRRGPSNYVAAILWDRTKDSFQLGQWLKGRIYERRSDLSPDGKYFIYFAMNGKWQSESKGSWTAISHAPYLKALTMLAKGDGWHGGGLWQSKNSYWLNDGYGHSVLQASSKIKRDDTFVPDTNYGGECPGVYYHRLIRDGWKYISHTNVAKWKDKHIFEKLLPSGWVLRKIAHAEVGAPVGKGCYWDEHELEHQASDQTLCFPNWEWADIDAKRIVWAEKGKLYAGKITSNGVMAKKELYDFNLMTFEPIQAPY